MAHDTQHPQEFVFEFLEPLGVAPHLAHEAPLPVRVVRPLREPEARKGHPPLLDIQGVHDTRLRDDADVCSPVPTCPRVRVRGGVPR